MPEPIHVAFAASLSVLAGCLSSTALAQQDSPFRLNGADSSLTIVIDGVERGKWTLQADSHPPELSLPVERDEATPICFSSAGQRACAEFVPGQTRTFEVVHRGTILTTAITAIFDRPAAKFGADYVAEFGGRTVVEVPEVYELMNIAIALTPTAISDADLVYRDSEYYRTVRTHFDRFASHPLIAKLDSALRAELSNYFPIKMNAYSLVFDQTGQIVRSPIYDRTGFNGVYKNAALPFLDDLNSFASESDFRAFYAGQQAVYDREKTFFENEADVGGINEWLMREFPTVPAYSGIKVIFSPLVAYNQSLTTIEADGYRELQAHINYPYDRSPGLTDKGGVIQRSAVLFTEMNHGFVNPTTKVYAAAVEAALSNRNLWANDHGAAANYPGAQLLFDEYMNWGLVGLYYHDRMTPEDFAIAYPLIVENLQDGRGFRKFSTFQEYLLGLYTTRQQGQTIEALYPSIIQWFAEQNSAAGSQY